ncbi:MAG TPA: hypothetical protein VES02_12385 [Dermatophilaceae bacterium]|nr:hypothetical protein [Dermatophilaceae bacterium]
MNSLFPLILTNRLEAEAVLQRCEEERHGDGGLTTCLTRETLVS